MSKTDLPVTGYRTSKKNMDTALVPKRNIFVTVPCAAC